MRALIGRVLWWFLNEEKRDVQFRLSGVPTRSRASTELPELGNGRALRAARLFSSRRLHERSALELLRHRSAENMSALLKHAGDAAAWMLAAASQEDAVRREEAWTAVIRYQRGVVEEEDLLRVAQEAVAWIEAGRPDPGA